MAAPSRSDADREKFVAAVKAKRTVGIASPNVYRLLDGLLAGRSTREAA